MAYNTGTTYTTGTTISASLMNGVGLDLRTRGGDQDGAGYSLLNNSTVAATTLLAGSGAPAIATLVAHAATNQNFAVKGNASLADGILLESLNDANTGFKGMQIEATTIAINVATAGKVGIGTASPTSPLHVTGIPTYASDAAAGTGGLTAGAFYKDSGGGLHIKL